MEETSPGDLRPVGSPVGSNQRTGLDCAVDDQKDSRNFRPDQEKPIHTESSAAPDRRKSAGSSFAIYLIKRERSTVHFGSRRSKTGQIAERACHAAALP